MNTYLQGIYGLAYIPILGSSTMPISYWGGQQFNCFSVQYDVEGLEDLGELLTYVSRLEKLFLILAKKCCIDGLRELASETGSKPVERRSILHPCPFLWTFMSSVIRRCLPRAGWSFLLHITSGKDPPWERPAACFFSWFQIHSTCQSIKTITGPKLAMR